MQVSYKQPIDHHGLLSNKRMHLGPMLPIPVNYETAAIPTYAPFGTEYTPEHTMQIIAGRPIAYPRSNVPMRKFLDPDLAPTKALQTVQAVDNARWPQQAKSRFDTTYRTEYINRLRHPDQYNGNNRYAKASFNQYSVLPPIGGKVNSSLNAFRNEPPARTDAHSQMVKNEQETVRQPGRVPDIHVSNSHFYENQVRPMNTNEDSYLPAEPVLLTDYEEQRLAEQIRLQLSSSSIVDRLKLFYQELTSYDPQRTSFVHYSIIRTMANQLGLHFEEDTLRFAMCKFVSPNQLRGFVNYEDMIRYIGKCLSAIPLNQFSRSQMINSTNFHGYHHEDSPYRHQPNPYMNYSSPHHYRP